MINLPSATPVGRWIIRKRVLQGFWPKYGNLVCSPAKNTGHNCRFWLNTSFACSTSAIYSMHNDRHEGSNKRSLCCGFLLQRSPMGKTMFNGFIVACGQHKMENQLKNNNKQKQSPCEAWNHKNDRGYSICWRHAFSSGPLTSKYVTYIPCPSD